MCQCTPSIKTPFCGRPGCEWPPQTQAPSAVIIHIAGHVNQIGRQLRQRCSWCGATLIDMDLSCIAVPEGQDPTPNTWEPGRLVGIDGPMSYLVEHKDGERLPEGACGRLDPEVTR